MALTIHYATRLDHLAHELGERLQAARPGPFETIPVLLPAHGSQRWLRHLLSHHLGAAPGRAGIAAGIDYRTPRDVIEVLLPAGADPWEPGALPWRILGVVDECANEDWAAPLARHIGSGLAADHRHRRRYPAARRISTILTGYARARPDLLRGWAQGGEPVEEDLRWQAQLYRELLTRIGEPPRPLQASVDLLAGHPGTALHLFGYTHLGQADLELLEIIAGGGPDTHLWVCHPSPANFRAGGPATNPILRSLGVQVGRFAEELRARFPDAAAQWHGPPAGPVAPRATNLAGIQESIQADTPPVRGGGEQPDRSIEVHGCHNPNRQVEVLRELLVDLFEENDGRGHPRYEPRDVLILCADLPAYAPLIEAAFGSREGAAHPGHRIPVVIGDLPATATNPLIDLAKTLLGLVADRVRSSELVDLLHRDEVKGRFAWSGPDVERLTAWIVGSGIRWGLDADDRGRFGLDTPQNTVRAGIDRLVLGAMVPEGEILGGVVSHGGIGSTELDLLGSLLEFFARLRTGLTELRGATTLTEWADAIGVLTRSLARAHEEWHEIEFSRLLGSIAAHGPVAAGLSDVRRFLSDSLREGGSPALPRTGAVEVASFTPGRVVPHRVICLIGMDDGALADGGTFDGDNLLVRSPRPGEENPRTAQRQLFLDALMAATDRLLVTYSCVGEERGEEQFPALPVAELLDGLAAVAGRSAEQLVTRQPLHPFDTRYFTPSTGLISYDSAAAGAARGRAEVTPRPALLEERLAPVEQPDLSPAQLKSFFTHPVKTFFRTRLEISLDEAGDETDDAIPLELTGLQQWHVAEQLLSGWRTDTLSRAADVQRYGGELPPGALGQALLEEIGESAAELWQHASPHTDGPRGSVDVSFEIADTRIQGRVPGIYGSTLVLLTYSNLKPSHDLRAWIDLLCLTLAEPRTPWRAIVVGRKAKSPHRNTIVGPTVEQAREYLAALLDVRARGLREPIPLPSATAGSWAKGDRQGPRSPEVIDAWEKAHYGPENQDPYHVRAWGRVLSTEELFDIPPRKDERWDSQASRLGQYAARVWDPLLEHLEEQE